ncbi:filamentous hemagglutinin N-terminal domain-containing protein [Helicobacter pullorum]|uniref:filamentous hemagglutinin N-terminal domain-containing protein n=1 Tax=Helicobacter pullorum TaxID=35818 RepID=UPI00242ED3E5|nr:filamentous hemagglutinin N-terminal domain-containing protein [Helicobacter pullorum]
MVLSQSLVALPSGGKFTHGSGSIKVNGKEMDITGNNKNHIIAWGGGFNINQEESVNFNTSHKQQASFLNLDYSNQASKILGQLKGNNHNIYLVNPSGVLIGENASINANKFVASNTIDDTTLNNFKDKVNDTNAITTFSPVFKPNKGNIVNLGTIKANNGITLIGDTIDIRGGKIENTSGGTNKDNSIYFVGENIYIDADAVNLSSNNIYATAFKEGYIQRQMKNFQKDSFTFGNFKQLITDESYAYNDNGNISGQSNFKKVITLGNGNADEALSEWYWFANGWNNNNGDTRSVDEFRLVGNIDFSKQIGGRDRYIIDFSKNENDIDRKFTYSGNYADPNGNSNYDDAMIVGMDLKANGRYFDIDFNGNNHMLSNIDMNINYNSTFKSRLVGIFGVIGSYPSSNITPITIENLIIDGIKIKIKDDKSAIQGVGGFAGDVNNVNVNNLIINNVSIFYEMKGMPAGHTGNAGGFIGHAGENNIISNVILNNITLEGKGNYDMNFGGFIGACYMSNCNSKISNVVLNNVRDIKVESEANDFTTLNSIFIGGFIGYLRNYDVSIAEFSDVFIYFNPNSILKASGEDNNRSGFGKFYGSLSGKTTFDNINLYYNDNPSPSLANPIKDADSSNSTYYNQTINPTTPETNKINLYTYSDSAQGIKDFQTALEQQNNSGGAFETNKIVNIGDDSNPIYSFEQTTGSNITPPDSNTPNIDLGNVALEKDDFISLDSTIKEIIHEILNENYGINIALDKNGYISQETLDKLINISNTIDEILKGIESKESEATLDTKIHKLFELILVDSNPNTAELESLKQSLNFLRAFYDGDNGLKDDFTKWYSKDNSIDKYSYVKDSILKLKSFINGEGSYNENGLINQISSINNNLKALESLKQRIKAAQKYYQEALKAKLPYETLEGIYNGMVKTINESYIQALGVLETLKGEDRDYLIHLYKEYSIKEDSGFDDIRGTFSFSGNDILSKIDSIILEDKPALTPPTKEEVGDDPTKENNPDVPNNLQKIADLASKEAILILPAQEKQEAIVEDGKERGRLCIVSDNAKTNNPCMAITY